MCSVRSVQLHDLEFHHQARRIGNPLRRQVDQVDFNPTVVHECAQEGERER